MYTRMIENARKTTRMINLSNLLGVFEQLNTTNCSYALIL